MKKKSKDNFLVGLKYTAFVLLILLLLVFIVYFIGVSAGTWGNFLPGLFGGGGNDLPGGEIDTRDLDTGDTCSDFDIGEMYNKAAGGGVIDAWESQCESVGGIWTESDSEISCYWNPDLVTVDCSGVGVRNLRLFCEDYLLADWTCDNGIAFVGCLCDERLPNDWNKEFSGDCTEHCQDDNWEDGFSVGTEDECIDTLQEMAANDEIFNGAYVGDGCCCYDSITPEDFGPDGEYTVCTDVLVPLGTGDVGGYCEDNGYCFGKSEGFRCDNYFDYNAKQHKCACTQTFFCQYCYEYFYTNVCVCPPGSYKQLTSRSTFVCIPDGYDTCVDGVPEKTGPFPE